MAIDVSVFIFFIASLAAFRLALMFAKENGPGRIFRKLRAAAPPRSATREGISCVLCESVWWAFAITAYLCFRGDVPLEYAPIYWLAVSALAVVINQAFTKGDL